MAHAFHTLSLMPLGNVATNERDRYRIEAVGKHFVDVVDQFPRYAILVRGQAFAQPAHGPIHPIPVQGGEAGPDTEGGTTEIGP